MNQRQMQAYHNRLCRQLGIPPAHVMTVNVPQNVMARYILILGIIQVHPGRVQKGTGNTKDCSWRWLVAHETYHHYQYYKGWLTPAAYRGKSKSDIAARLPYSQWPWERAANRFANKQMETKYD